MPNQRLKMFEKQMVVKSSNSVGDGPMIQKWENSHIARLIIWCTPAFVIGGIAATRDKSANVNFGAGDNRNVLTRSETSSTSAPISLKS